MLIPQTPTLNKTPPSAGQKNNRSSFVFVFLSRCYDHFFVKKSFKPSRKITLLMSDVFAQCLSVFGLAFPQITTFPIIHHAPAESVTHILVDRESHILSVQANLIDGVK